MTTTVRDPVCGMDIDPNEAAATSEYEGALYYFCAAGCKLAFDSDPAKFVGSTARPAQTYASAAPARKWWQFWK